MKLSTTIVLISALTVSACEVTGPKIKVEPPKVKIDGVKVESHGSQSHCPPGQAKKGKC